MTLIQRSTRRRQRMVVHRANGHDDAERWDLEYWQAQTPQDRLSALVVLRNDLEKIHHRKPKRR